MQMGSNLGRYKITAEIGRGAMGVVYRADDPHIGRPVAIKTVSLAGLDQEDETEYRQRFAQEAKAAGRLSHPGVVTVFDVGEDSESNTPFIVMEYVAGESLKKRISGASREVPLPLALKLAQEIAEALHYAHSQGVVHRDIKPANILITPDNHAKIADFGIAKLNFSNLTMDGRVLGSPAYMSPEQMSGDIIDARSDLFSLGVVLYSMLTGYAPFQGNSATTVLFKVANRDPLPVSEYGFQFPVEVDRVIARCLAKNPSDRYQSGLELAQDLEALRRLPLDGSAAVLLPSETSTRTKFIARAENAVSVAMQPKSPSSANGGRAQDPKASNHALAGFIIACAIMAIGGAAYIGSHLKTRKKVEQSSTLQTVVAKAESSPSGGITKISEPKKVDSPADLVAQDTVTHKRSSTKPLPVAVRIKPQPVDSKPLEMADVAIDIEHSFVEASASVWVDEKVVYEHALHGVRSKRALVFQRVKGYESSSVQLPVGAHDIRVTVKLPSGTDQSNSVTAQVVSGKQNVLHIRCDPRSSQIAITME